MAPAWYKSRSYRARAIREPRKVLAEFGLIIPEQVRRLLSLIMSSFSSSFLFQPTHHFICQLLLVELHYNQYFALINLNLKL